MLIEFSVRRTHWGNRENLIEENSAIATELVA